MIGKRTTRRDITCFLVLFAVAAAAGIVALLTYVKVLLAILLIMAYAVCADIGERRVTAHEGRVSLFIELPSVWLLRSFGTKRGPSLG